VARHLHHCQRRPKESHLKTTSGTPERLLASKGLWRSRLRLLRRQEVSIHDYDQPYRLFRKKSNKRGKNTWQQ